MRSFLQGVTDPLRGMLFLIQRPSWFPILLAPVMFTAALFLALLAWVVLGSGDWLSSLWARPESDWLLPLHFLARGGMIVAAAALLYLLFAPVSAAVAAPFLTRLTKKMRADLEGIPPKAPSGLHADVIYPIWLGLRLLLLAVAIQGTAFLLQAALPGSSFVLLPLQLVLAAFSAALTFLDYPLESEGALPGLRGRWRYGLRHAPRTLGFGLSLLLLLSIPLLGLLLLPAGVAGAVLFFHDERDRARSPVQ